MISIWTPSVLIANKEEFPSCSAFMGGHIILWPPTHACRIYLGKYLECASCNVTDHILILHNPYVPQYVSTPGFCPGHAVCICVWVEL